jgi:CRP-like cAMP-binding protein
MMFSETPKNNGLIRELSPSDYEALAPHLRQIRLPFGQTLFETRQNILAVIFPTSGIVSFVVELLNGEAIEAGMIGNDGVVGASAILDGKAALNKATVQMEGAGYAIDLEVMRYAAQASGTLRESLFRHDQMLLIQAQQSVACNARHTLEARLCRWLLRCRDLAESGSLSLTQEYMAQMLGVQRSTLSMVAHRLQASGIIEYRRGHVQILNVDGLKECACECYEATRGQQSALLGKS